MGCNACGTANPELAAHCFKCGNPLRRSKHHAYALRSNEHVSHLSALSTFMPHGDRHGIEGYRTALGVGGALVLVLTFLGYGPAALIAAACLVPVTYLLYLYEVNVWEDAPLKPTLLLIGLSLILSAVISLFFFRWVFDSDFAKLGQARVGSAFVIPLLPLLLFGVILPVVATIAMTVGPSLVTRIPGLDDMIDGFTFGVAAGTAYAAAETIVAYLPALSGGRSTSTVGTWIPVILNLMIIKSVLYGAGAGIIVASFSGPRRGVAGFTNRHASAVGLVASVNVVYWVGVHLLGHVQGGRWLALVLGGVLAAFLLLRSRLTLHGALLEAALEDVRGQEVHPFAAIEGAACPECGMPLLAGALFCVICGQSVRASSGSSRRKVRGQGGAA